MMSFTKVSIVIPVYNVEDYLKRCLDSVLSQTLFDIDIICVDDGSTDSSGHILDEYQKRDPRIKVIHKENGGLSSARNAGIKAAKGEWITFLDSDDFIEPNFCERIWVETMQAPTDIVIFNTKIFPEEPHANPWYYDVLCHVRDKRATFFQPGLLFWENGGKPFVWRQAFRAALLKENAILFDENVRYGEDLIFQCEIFPLAKNFAFISDALYDYMWIREGSLMSGLDKDMNIKIGLHLDMVEIIAKFWMEHGLLEKYGRAFLQWLLEFTVPDLLENELEKKNELVSRLKSIIEKYDLNQYAKSMSVLSRKRYKELQKM